MTMGPITRKGILALLLALLAVLISTTLTFAQSTFTIVSSPSPGTLQNEVQGVSATSNTDVWAVGFSNSILAEGSSLGDRTLTEHWNGSRWSIIRSPNVSTHTYDASFLVSVSAVATNDAWAVGSSNVNDAAVDEPLAEHWNGSNWNIFPVPTTHTGENLFAVSADAPNDAWAVGQFTDYKPYFTGGPVIHHWNGSSWNNVAVPVGVTRVDGVVALSNTNAWAIGATQILHWNGTQWSIFPISFTQGYTVLFSSISADSASDIWVTGGNLGIIGTGSFFAHFNGSTWQLRENGSDTQFELEEFTSIAAHSSSDALAVAFNVQDGKPAIDHWNGRVWTPVSPPALPNPGHGNTANAQFNTATITPGSDAWIGGYEAISTQSATTTRTLTEQCMGC